MNPSHLAPSPAPRLLISVRDDLEANAVAEIGPCLIDAKDPGSGALGALPTEVVRRVVAAVGGRCATSAVAGEPETWKNLLESVAIAAGTGVDMVKVAWPRQGGAPDQAVRDGVRSLPCPVVAVFFAETRPTVDDVAAAVRAGFRGAMIDTCRKDGRSLLDHLSTTELRAFVGACRRHGIMSGLAGSLRIGDIPGLGPLLPTYLGFRGGLCRGRDREAQLDTDRVADALAALDALHKVEHAG
jgi:(5-formylfuran-3-yl)methyl phosphate synthase